jgi:hypothetical protein
MALPLSHRNPHIERLAKLVREVGERELFRFPHLSADVVQMFGAFIQYYNFIDMNLRRSVEAFAIAEKLPAEVQRKYLKLSSTALVPTVKAVVQTMDPSVEDVPDALGKLDEIEFRRPFRNLFAHWAAKRIPNEDAIVFFTKNEADALQTSGTGLEVGNVSTGVMDLADLRGLCIHIEAYERWIAVKTSDWYFRYVEQGKMGSE